MSSPLGTVGSWVKSIKSERVATPSSWRYKLLHWAFGIGPDRVWWDTEGKVHSPLPHFLYTHYCPLFHLTNAVFVLTFLLPVIPAMKVFYAVAAFFAGAAAMGLRAVKRALPRRPVLDIPIATGESLPPTDAQKKAAKARLLKSMAKTAELYELEDWGAFRRGGYVNETSLRPSPSWVPYLTPEEIKAIWLEHAPLILERKRAELAALRAMQARITRWVQLSERVAGVTLKGAGILLAIAAVPTLAWVLYHAVTGLWAFCVWVVTSVTFWDVLLVVSNGLFWASAALLTLLVLHAVCKYGRIYKLMAAPVRLAGRGAAKVGGGLLKAADASADFVSMFYLENCPPVRFVPDGQSSFEEDQ